MKQWIECNTNDNIIEYVTYNDDGEKKIINVCSKCLDYFNYYNDVHTTNCDICGSLLEVEESQYKQKIKEKLDRMLKRLEED